MFRKPRKVHQAIDPGHEVAPKKSRFQIVKLEERIAPSHCDIRDCHGNHGGGNGGGGCHTNPQGKLVGPC